MEPIEQIKKAMETGLPPPSDEQQKIIDAVKTGCNIIVDAVAGSGKTTTILHIATKYPGALMLTYNARLRHETKTKAKDIVLDVHTYHSYGCWHGLECQDDSGFIKYLADSKPLIDINYPLIIIDECQDMSKNYYQWVRKIIEYNAFVDPQLIIIGDRYQSIYQYVGADPRFITCADQIFDTKREWLRLNLSVSYRLTVQMADFLNNCVLGHQRLTASKDEGLQVNYVVHEWGDAKNVMKRIKETAIKYSSDQIFILSPTIKPGPNSPLKPIANKLTKCEKLIYFPTSDDGAIDEKLIKSKAVFSTFNQVKGLERDHVFVLSFDLSYHIFYAKNSTARYCPNALYVALTRARKTLTVFHLKGNLSLPYLDIIKTQRCANIIGEIPQNGPIEIKYKPIERICATDLIKHISSDVIDRCKNLLHISAPNWHIKCNKELCIPSVVSQIVNGENIKETVSDINGIAIPAYFELTKRDKMSISPRTKLPLASGELLKIAANYTSERSGLNYRNLQINNYNWLTEKQLEETKLRLNNVIVGAKEELAFEYSLTDVEYGGIIISGVIDVADSKQNKIFEIKTVSELTSSHYLQLAIYMYMVETTARKNNSIRKWSYWLYNIITDDLMQITADYKSLEHIISLLICVKTHTEEKTDEETTTDKFLLSLNISQPVSFCERCKYKWNKK